MSLRVAVRHCNRAVAACNRMQTGADTDDLTGLWNRHVINCSLQKGCCIQPVDAQYWSVVFVDINGLKSINDLYGHLVGDCVLKEFAKSLSHSIRSCDCAVRWGGDEFIILVSGIRSNADFIAFCNNLQRETSKTITVDGNKIKISASFGYALARVDGDSINDLIRVADSRMYKNKQYSSAVFR